MYRAVRAVRKAGNLSNPEYESMLKSDPPEDRTMRQSWGSERITPAVCALVQRLQFGICLLKVIDNAPTRSVKYKHSLFLLAIVQENPISPYSDLSLHSASTGALTSHSLTNTTSSLGGIVPYQMNFPSFFPFLVSSTSL